MPQLDHYENVGINDDEQQELNAAERRNLERKMDQERALQRHGHGRQADAFNSEGEYSETNMNTRTNERRPMMAEDEGSDEGNMA